MTCGIYKLMFKGTNKVYIGQSTNIDRRYKEHLANFITKKCNNKLLKAYDDYGVPNYEVLEECTEELLEELEIKYTQAYNCIEEGLNVCLGSPIGTATGSGVGHSKAKYSKEAILRALEALKSPSNLLPEVSIRYDVSTRVLQSIFYRQRHAWVDIEYPQLIDEVLKANRIRLSKSVSDSYAYREPINPKRTPTIVSPAGEVILVSGTMQQFCITNNLNASSMSRVVCGTQKEHRGWTKYIP